MSVIDVWRNGNEIVSRIRMLILIPLLLDLLFYTPIIGQSGMNIHFQLTIPSSLPSIRNLLPNVQALTGETNVLYSAFSTYPGTILTGIMAAVLISFLVMPYLTAGYLGTIARHIQNPQERMSFHLLAVKYFGRIFTIQAAMIVFTITLSPLALIPLLGLIVFLVMLAVLVLLFFWEYSVVFDDVDVVTAFKNAFRTFTSNTETMLVVLITTALVLAPLSALASAVMYSPLFLLMMALYAYVGAVLVSGFMALYADLRRAEEQRLTPPAVTPE